MMFNDCGMTACKGNDIGGLGVFEQSLRGGDSPSADRKVLHKGCCGTLHGNGVRKERSELLAVVGCRKKCSLDSTSSEDSTYQDFHHKVASRSHSTDCSGRFVGDNSTLPRRSSSAVAQRLYSSTTKAQVAKTKSLDDRKDQLVLKKNLYSGSKSTSSLPRRIKLSPAENPGKIMEPLEADLPKPQDEMKRLSIVSFLSGDSRDRKRTQIHGLSDDDPEDQGQTDTEEFGDDSDVDGEDRSSGEASKTNSKDIVEQTRGRRKSSSSLSEDSRKNDQKLDPKNRVTRSSSTAPVPRSSNKMEIRRAKSSGSSTAPIPMMGARNQLAPPSTVGFGSTVSRFDTGPRVREKRPAIRTSSRDNVTTIKINIGKPAQGDANGIKAKARANETAGTSSVDPLLKTSSFKIDIQGKGSLRNLDAIGKGSSGRIDTIGKASLVRHDSSGKGSLNKLDNLGKGSNTKLDSLGNGSSNKNEEGSSKQNDQLVKVSSFNLNINEKAGIFQINAEDSIHQSKQKEILARPDNEESSSCTESQGNENMKGVATKKRSPFRLGKELGSSNKIDQVGRSNLKNATQVYLPSLEQTNCTGQLQVSKRVENPSSDKLIESTLETNVDDNQNGEKDSHEDLRHRREYLTNYKLESGQNSPNLFAVTGSCRSDESGKMKAKIDHGPKQSSKTTEDGMSKQSLTNKDTAIADCKTNNKNKHTKIEVLVSDYDDNGKKVGRKKKGVDALESMEVMEVVAPYPETTGVAADGILPPQTNLGFDPKFFEVVEVKPHGGVYKDFPTILQKAREETDVTDEGAWLEAERVWLVHRDGFSAGRQVRETDGGEPLGEGLVRVRLDSSDEVIQVEEDDVERANPPSFDRVEDLSQLRYLNESSALHALRQRYGNNLTYTYAGPSLISINPCSPLPIYSSKIINMFKGCRLEDMPPHIYSVAHSAYRTLLYTKQDQSVAMLGRSGSGKTTNLRHVLSYLASVPPENKILSLDRLEAIHLLLDAFGSCRTLTNENATRFSQIFSVDFDHSGSIVSGSIQAMMLERWRVVRRPDGEENFKIFYQLMAGLEAKVKRELLLENSVFEQSLLFAAPQTAEERLAAAAAFLRLVEAARTLSFGAEEWRSIVSVLAGIFHLAAAGSVCKGTSGRNGFNKSQAAHRAAHCLGVSLEELSRAVFQGGSGSGTLTRRSSRGETTTLSEGMAAGHEALENFIVGLYSEVFQVLIALINRSLGSGVHSAGSILLVDTPGIVNPATVGRLTGAGLDELGTNYIQERLQLLFHNKSIHSLKERYESENIEVPDLEDLTELCTPAPLVQLIDRQSTLRNSQSDLGQIDRRGLLWLLDEETMYPGGSDTSFTQRMLQQYDRADRGGQGFDDLIKSGPDSTTFILQHFQGTNPVLYNSSGWVKVSRENTICKQAVHVLLQSQDKGISTVFLEFRSVGGAVMTGSLVGADANQALRRASSIRRAFTSSSAGLKRHSAALQVKFHTDSIVEQLRRTKTRFVHCFLPHNSAGLGEQTSVEPGTFSVPLIRSQLRGSQLLDAVRLHKVGFPESIQFKEFIRRFTILGESPNLPGVTIAVEADPGAEESARSRVDSLLTGLDVEPASYRLGNTQVFLRASVLPRLEEARDERLKERIIQLQAVARGYLARKQLQKLKTQDIAIKCIQKNVRKFIGVRGWAWWRLLVKVTPLLNVQRTEELLKQRELELETLKQRLDKSERERKEYKDQAEKNQAMLSEMTADLTEEHNASTLATERLETEQAERLKLEREKADLVSRNKSLSVNTDRLELELLHSRAMDVGGNDDDSNGVIYRSKYERAMKDLDHTKKLLSQQHEDDLEQLLALKKQLEKKLNDAYEEVEDQRQVVAQWKRKTQKLQGEMNDTRLLLEEQTARNTLLEKKQRKFDSELALVQEDRRQDQLSKEKVQKELDSCKQNKARLEEQIQAMKLDVETKDEKISLLQKEITEIQMGGTTEEEVRNLKKGKRDLEMQLKEQEEELDDLAAQVQMLEASRTKLEMEMAAIKKEHRRELGNKDEEIEEARASANKKVKILEQQLEQEHEERIMFLRERHELEQKIGTLQDMLERSGDEEQVSKLKKDLKKTKALLRDAQTLVEKNQNEGTNKVILRQLKNQLEDAEFARTAAMKARQNAELELADTMTQLEDVSRNKQELEDRHLRLGREKAELASQLQENEEELQEVMRKYKASVAAVSTDQITIQDQQTSIQELENERNKLRDQVAELSSRLGNLEGENVSTSQHKRLELKVRELENKLELEVTSKNRLETQIARLKECIDKLGKEKDECKVKEQNSVEQQKKMARQLRDLKEDFTSLQGKETELGQKKFDLEKQLEVAEAETLTIRSDLKLALKRIEDLQAALVGEIDSDNSDDNSDSSDGEMHSFLEHHRRAMSVQRERESMARESVLRDSVGRDSVLRESVSRELRGSVGRTFSALEETLSVDRQFSSTIEEVDESLA